MQKLILVCKIIWGVQTLKRIVFCKSVCVCKPVFMKRKNHWSFSHQSQHTWLSRKILNGNCKENFPLKKVVFKKRIEGKSCIYTWNIVFFRNMNEILSNRDHVRITNRTNSIFQLVTSFFGTVFKFLGTRNSAQTLQ